MPEYRFSYKRGRVTASFGVTASIDSHAFKRMQLFTRQHNVKYIAGSMHTFSNDGRWHPLAKAKPVQKRRPLTLQAAE